MSHTDATSSGPVVEKQTTEEVEDKRRSSEESAREKDNNGMSFIFLELKAELMLLVQH